MRRKLPASIEVAKSKRPSSKTMAQLQDAEAQAIIEILQFLQHKRNGNEAS